MHYQTTVAARQPLAESSLLRLTTAAWLRQYGETKRVKKPCAGADCPATLAGFVRELAALM
jgi:hypothetical protein